MANRSKRHFAHTKFPVACKLGMGQRPEAFHFDASLLAV